MGFQFDPEQDTADGLAHEMVENLSLNVEEADAIAAMIQHELRRRQQGEQEAGAAAGAAPSEAADGGPTAAAP